MKEEVRVAIIVNPHLPIGLMANTIGAVSIGLGAKRPGLGGSKLTDLRGRTINVSSNRPVPILQATYEEMARLLLKAIAQADDHTVVPFPSFARSLHDYADYEAVFPSRDLAEETIDGLGIAGPSKWVKSLTGSLKLLR
ncbi:DUF2000 domain-containing protein [Rhizobium sp. Root1203]|uniref:DUF2000 domain-containing protein n=1 Tax=Rhizobium sp. Root1203 TaxID=1736427 RepID=UPI0009E94CF9|nr:DUF2000 domain-containing protein [Rhizobium sp. Root1203]